jgi:hypothetical protein
MLVIDPDKRMSVDEALNHLCINVWYEDSEVNAVSLFILFNRRNLVLIFYQSSEQYNHLVAEREYTVEQSRIVVETFSTMMFTGECGY